MGKTRIFRFVIPQLKKEILGTQGEVAQYIPYRMEENLTGKDILDELRAQPHMAALADYISKDRKIYLIDSESTELLQLAAEYIGTYHRLANNTCADVEVTEDLDEDKLTWESGDTNLREFDFSSRMPYLLEHDVMRVFDPDEGIGFGGRFYQQDHASSRPWWTMSPRSPVVMMVRGSLNAMPGVLRAMENRERIILLHERSDHLYDESCWQGAMRMEDLGFEMETEMLVLSEPGENSPYKKAVLRQLAQEKGTSLSRSFGAEKLLSLVRESRGDINNSTLAKVISNALLRKKDRGTLCARDFEYLSTIRSNGKHRGKGSSSEGMELVGQDNVRRQLNRIVNSMVFQKRRKKMGLPGDEFHYTFAFLGAPGTGKTTWAMRLADQMEKLGLLENTDCICVNAAELKAQYVGHTTGKVKALFEQYGVIILDEAYSLTEGEHGDSFGAEALAQLCVELEKHGNDRLVIFAGYGGSDNAEDNRMLRFLQCNPGINSRVSFKIHFENFRPTELVGVFRAMMTHSGYTIPAGADPVLESFFCSRVKARAFGNCREVRNLVDRVKIYVAQRLADCEQLSDEAAAKVLVEDVKGAAREILEEYEGLAKEGRKSIGFGA